MAPGSASTRVDTGPTQVRCTVTVATGMAAIPFKARRLAGERPAPLSPQRPCLQVAFLQATGRLDSAQWPCGVQLVEEPTQ